MTWNKNTHTRIMGGFSNAFSVLPLKSMKTQPRASDESKYGEENIHMKGGTGAQGSLEEMLSLHAVLHPNCSRRSQGRRS